MKEIRNLTNVLMFTLIPIFMYSQNITTTDLERLPGFNDDNAPNYKLAWYDNFTYLDQNRWQVVNNHDQWGESAAVKIDDNVSIENQEYLRIDIKKEAYQCPSTDDYYCVTQKESGDPSFEYKYTSGEVISKCGFEMDNGYMEARIKFPREPGTWTSFWAYRTDCNNPNALYGEIDVVEVWPSKFDWLGLIDKVQTNIHICEDCPNPYGGQMYSLPSTTDVSDWHIYAAKWNEDEIRFYLDGVLIRTEQNNHVNLEQKFDMLLSAFVEPAYNETLKHFFFTNSTQTMLVDWVRVYEEVKPCVSQEVDPYLVNSVEDPSSSGKSKVTLMWQLPCETDIDNCQVDWGISQSYGNTANLTDNGTDHLYRHDMTNLQPNTKYYYKVVYKEGQYISHVEFGSFISAPLDNATTTTFYATGSTSEIGQTGSEAQHDDVSSEILNQMLLDPSSQTFILQTGNFVTADNREFWVDEYFNSNMPQARELRLQLPILSPVSSNQKKYQFLYTDGSIFFEKEYRGQNYRSYFPYDYTYPYISIDPTTGYSDFKYHLSYDYGPLNIQMPEVINVNTNKDDILLLPSNKEWKILSFNTALKSLNGEILNPAAYDKIRNYAISNDVQLVLMSSEDYYAHWVENSIHFMIIGNGGVNTNRIDDQKMGSNELIYASTVPHFAKFKIDGDMMYVDVIQGADYNGYLKGRKIESFAIPKTQLITTNTVWESDASHPIISENMTRVYANATLDIKSEVQFVNSSKLIVNKQADLNLTNSNTLLTTHPGFTEDIDFITYDAQGNVIDSYMSSFTKNPMLWDGIIVQGLPMYSQNSYDQGQVTMSNGATVEHAECGVKLYEELVNNGITQKKGGGVLLADGAVFKDNIVDIWMYPYQNTYDGLDIPDRTRIENSTFKTTNDLINANANIRHIYLTWVNGVRIKGNSFLNTHNNMPRHKRGIGVYAYESSYKVVDQYLPTQLPKTENTFENLFYGVKSYNTIDNGVIRVAGNNFVDNYCGIYLGGSASAEVLFNEIEVADYDQGVLIDGWEPGPYGIYIHGGDGFRIEENDISPYNNYFKVHGIVVHNVGAKNNEIYKNTLEGLSVGLQSQFENRGKISGSSGPDVGLRFICNTHNNPEYDVWVMGRDETDNAPGMGIAENQVVSMYDAQNNVVKYPAGNTFTNTHISNDPANDDYDYSNYDAEFLIYHYGNGTGKRAPYLYSNIGLHLSNITNQCASNSSFNQIGLGQHYNNLHGAQVALNSSRIMLNIWKNGGNANLENEVETTQPYDVYIEYNDLMAESPYLSEEVIIEVIENPAFTALMVKLLMIANPHVINSDEVMDVLYSREPAMPETYIEEILAEEGEISQLDLLEADVAADYHLVRKIGEDIKRIYRADTVNSFALDSLINFVSRQQELSDRYELANIYLSNSMFEDMDICLSEIPSEFELSDQEYSDYQSYLMVFDAAEEAVKADVKVNCLTSEQVTNLTNIANSNRPGVSVKAISLLRGNDPELEWTEIVFNPNSEDQSGGIKGNEDKQMQIVKDNFKIYPNPAYDFVTVAYDENEEQYNALFIKIYNASGSLVLTQKLNSHKGEEMIDLTKLSTGVYTIILLGDNEAISVEKLDLID